MSAVIFAHDRCAGCGLFRELDECLFCSMEVCLSCMPDHGCSGVYPSRGTFRPKEQPALSTTGTGLGAGSCGICTKAGKPKPHGHNARSHKPLKCGHSRLSLDKYGHCQECPQIRDRLAREVRDVL